MQIRACQSKIYLLNLSFFLLLNFQACNLKHFFILLLIFFLLMWQFKLWRHTLLCSTWDVVCKVCIVLFFEQHSLLGGFIKLPEVPKFSAQLWHFQAYYSSLSCEWGRVAIITLWSTTLQTYASLWSHISV